jgi:hypothetical protein
MRKNLILILLLACHVQQAFSDERRTGTAGATQLLIPVGSIGLSLAGSSISSISGIEAIYWNPAGLARSDKGELMFSNLSYLADIKVNYLAGSLNLNDVGAFGFAVKSFNFGDISQTSADDPEGLLGLTFSPSFITASLSYSRLFTEKVAIGATAKIVSEQIAGVSAASYAFDFGIQYISPFDLKIGLVIKNLGGSMRYAGSDLQVLFSRSPGDGDQNKLRTQITAAEFELPAVFEIGVGYDIKLDKSATSLLALSGTFRNNNFSDDEYLLGAEYGFQKLFFLRAGYAIDVSGSQFNVFTNSMSFGAGLNLKIGGTGLRVDYAFRRAQIFDGNQSISVRVGF